MDTTPTWFDSLLRLHFTHSHTDHRSCLLGTLPCLSVSHSKLEFTGIRVRDSGCFRHPSDGVLSIWLSHGPLARLFETLRDERPIAIW